MEAIRVFYRWVLLAGSDSVWAIRGSLGENSRFDLLQHRVAGGEECRAVRWL
jgi:hypothetical protein